MQRSVWPGGVLGAAMAPAEGVGRGRGNSGSEASRRTSATGGAIGETVPVGKGRKEGFLLRSETPGRTDSNRWHPAPLSHQSPSRPDPGGRPPAASTQPLPEREGGWASTPQSDSFQGCGAGGDRGSRGQLARRTDGRRGHTQGPWGPMCTRLQKSSFSYRNLIVPKAEAASGELDE